MPLIGNDKTTEEEYYSPNQSLNDGPLGHNNEETIGTQGQWWWYAWEHPLAWDQCYLKGKQWPGICNITGTGIERKIDVKKSKGQDGATINDEGMELARFEIEFLLYSRYCWELFQEYLPDILPSQPGGPRDPISIIHPVPNVLGITEIYIYKISPPELDKSKGWAVVKLSAIEWQPEPEPVKEGTGEAYPDAGDVTDGLEEDWAAGTDETEEYAKEDAERYDDMTPEERAEAIAEGREDGGDYEEL